MLRPVCGLRFIAACLGGFMMLASTAARAEIVETFERFCVQTDGRPDAVERVAASQGWSAADPDFVQEFGGEGFTVVGFEKIGTDHRELVIAMISNDISSQNGVMMRASFCTIISTDIGADAEARLTGLLLSPGRSPEGNSTWLYSRPDSQVRGEPGGFASAQAITEIARQRSVFATTLRRQPQERVASLMAIGMLKPDPVIDRDVPVTRFEDSSPRPLLND